VRVHRLLDGCFYLGGHQLVLGLGGKLGIRHLDRHNRRETLTGIVAGGVDLGLLGQPLTLDIVVQRAGQRRAETRQVRTAVALGNVVGVAEDVFLIGVVPLQRDLDASAVLRIALEVKGLVDRVLVAVQVIDKGRRPPS
jgi:hypothetical protein